MAGTLKSRVGELEIELCPSDYHWISHCYTSLAIALMCFVSCPQPDATAAAVEAEPLAKRLRIREVATPQRRVKTYIGLDSDDVRHPLDAQNTRMLRRLPGLDFVAKSLMGVAHYTPFSSFILTTKICMHPPCMENSHLTVCAEQD